MALKTKSTFDYPELQGEKAALLRAAKKARELSRRAHTPFIVYQNGKIVDLNAKSDRRKKTSPAV